MRCMPYPSVLPPDSEIYFTPLPPQPWTRRPAAAVSPLRATAADPPGAPDAITGSRMCGHRWCLAGPYFNGAERFRPFLAAQGRHLIETYHPHNSLNHPRLYCATRFIRVSTNLVTQPAVYLLSKLVFFDFPAVNEVPACMAVFRGARLSAL